MSISDQLAAITARAEGATEGTWEWEATTPTMEGTNWNMRIKGKPGIRLAVHEYQHGPGNAEFIAHARQDVPRLVAALQAVLDACGTYEKTQAIYRIEIGQREIIRIVRAEIAAALGEENR